MVRAGIRVLMTIAALACAAGCGGDSGSANATSTSTASVPVAAAPTSATTDAPVVPVVDIATPSAAVNDDQVVGSCGGDSDRHNRVYECELGDLQAGNFAKKRCDWHGDFHAAELCGWNAPEMVYARDATNDSPFEAAITHASAGVIFIGDAQQGLDADNTIRLSIMSIDADEIHRIIDRHGSAAMQRTLALWAPVYARYHHGDRGVCVQITDGSLTPEEGRDIGYAQATGEYGEVIITQRCTAHT